VLQAGDIVIARTGATTGKSFLIEKLEDPTVFASYLIRVRFAGTVEPKYAWAFMRSEDYWSQIQIVSKGTAQPGANAQLLSKLRFPIAPLPEQRRIVAKIDSLSAKSKRARDQLDHIPRLVEKYKQAILAAAFCGELTREWRASVGCTDPWEDTTIGRLIIDIRYGTAKKCSYDGGAIGVLRIPNVQRGHIVLDDIKSADFSDSELETLRVEEGDILVIRSNGSLDLVGRSAVVHKAAAGMLFAGYLIRLRLDRGLADPHFFQFYLRAANTRALIERLAKSTSGVNNINSTQLKTFPLLRPTLNEQQEIVGRIETTFAWIDRLAVEATSARKLIDHLDQAILAKAFRGELVPQDPNDEPASVLLERIRAERQATPSTVTGKHGKRRPNRVDARLAGNDSDRRKKREARGTKNGSC
jgi:type I restriction enzyme, S subunit